MAAESDFRRHLRAMGTHSAVETAPKDSSAYGCRASFHLIAAWDSTAHLFPLRRSAIRPQTDEITHSQETHRHNFNLDDHERLADLLRQTPHDWLLSYEDHPAVWELCEGWATIKPLYKSRRIDTLAISNGRDVV
jgi:hypothetical protein